MPLISKTVKTSYADISVLETTGRGLPLVFLHGSGFSKSVFAAQFDSPLADHFRLISIDLPGHGMSGNAHDPSRGYTLSGFTDAVSEVLVQRKVNRAVVFGWSLGAHVALELLHEKQLVAGLVLSGAVPVSKGVIGMLKGMKLSRSAMLAGKARFSQADAEKFLGFVFGRAEGKQFLKSLVRADKRFRPIFARSFTKYDQRALIETTDVPVAMINGIDDPVVKQGYLAGLRYRNLWEEMSHIIPDAGHAAFWDQPAAFNALLGRFHNEVAAAETVGTESDVVLSA